MKLECATDAALYDLPLDVSIAAPKGWKGCKATQGGKEIPAVLRDGRVVATFHCDDAARTILTVTYASGEFTVMG